MFITMNLLTRETWEHDTADKAVRHANLANVAEGERTFRAYQLIELETDGVSDEADEGGDGTGTADPMIPAWLAYAGVPLEQIPENLRESVREHRENAG